MPKVSEAHVEARRRQILDAAFVCFARQGFHQTSMQDICRESGLSAGAVYGYFASKEEIIAASCAGCQQSGELLVDLDKRGSGTVEILDGLTEAGFGEFDQPGADVWLQVNVQWWSEALRNPELRDALLRTGVGPLKAGLADIISRAQEKGEVDPALSPEAVARVLLAMWQGLVLQKALEPGVDVGAYVEAVKAVYAGSLWQTEGRENGKKPTDNGTHLA